MKGNGGTDPAFLNLSALDRGGNLHTLITYHRAERTSETPLTGS